MRTHWRPAHSSGCRGTTAKRWREQPSRINYLHARRKNTDFLGFTHFWSRSKQGLWVVKRTTAGSRFRRALTKIAVWCRQNRHLPIRVQYEILAQKLQGHYAYYGGLIGNKCRLLRFRREVVRLWQKWLSRRHRRGRWPWPRFTRLLQVLVFPWPRGWVTPCVVNP